MNNSIHLSNYMFNNLRIIILICFCLWFVVIFFDRFLFDTVSSNYNSYIYYVPYENETLVQNGTVHYRTLTKYVNLLPEETQNYDVVLLWTTYFSNNFFYQGKENLIISSFGGGYSSHPLRRPKSCYQKYPDCLITTDRAYLLNAKAIVFHWRDFYPNDLPPKRLPNQLWTLYNLEAPPNTHILPDIEDPNLLFNLTATYRTDSDLVIPYGKVSKRDVALNDFNQELKVDLRYKSKPIAWFVSNCKTQSHREDYVQQLSKFIKVDIYGKCGNLKCDVSLGERCYLDIAREYLFYLSFENSICKDYVTEKLFNILSYDIIPVVFGGANYSSFMPPNSYIDATEMKPRKLAKLMIEISNDMKKYLSYFAWRKHYFVEQEQGYNERLYCELCKVIKQQKTSTLKKNKSMTVKEINSWFFGKPVCNTEKVHLFR